MEDRKRKYNRTYYQKNREKIRKDQKSYRERNPEKIKKLKRNYYENNKEIKLLKDKIYVLKNREIVKKRRQKHYENNKEIHKSKVREVLYRNLETWRGYIPNETICQVCNKRLVFNSGSLHDAIHFDHRNEGFEPIKQCPTPWLSKHRFNEDNKKIWEESNFGFLCMHCNHRLPTRNRKEWMLKAVKYVFGLNAFISVPSLSA